MPDEKINNTWPKSTRLNQENRERFVRTVVEDLIPLNTRPTTQKFGEKWGDKLYEDIYGPHKETMDLLPSWMFVEAKEFVVDIKLHAPTLDGESVTFYLSEPKRMVNEESFYGWRNQDSRDYCIPQIPEDHDVIQAWEEHKQANKDWQSKHSELKRTLEQVSDACNTSHQLFRAWPKAVKYAEQCFPYVEPRESKRGGQTDISAEELDLTAKIAQTTVVASQQN